MQSRSQRFARACTCECDPLATVSQLARRAAIAQTNLNCVLVPDERNLCDAAARRGGQDVACRCHEPPDRDIVVQDMNDEAAESTIFGGLHSSLRELGAEALLLPVVAHDESDLGAVVVDRAEAHETDDRSFAVRIAFRD